MFPGQSGANGVVDIEACLLRVPPGLDGRMSICLSPGLAVGRGACWSGLGSGGGSRRAASSFVFTCQIPHEHVYRTCGRCFVSVL